MGDERGRERAFVGSHNSSKEAGDACSICGHLHSDIPTRYCKQSRNLGGCDRRVFGGREGCKALFFDTTTGAALAWGALPR